MSGFNSSPPAAPDALDASSGDPLAMTVHDVGAPQLLDQGAQRRGRWMMLGVLLVCLAPVVISYLMYFVVPPSGRTNYATLIEPQRPIPATLPLRDLQGQAVTPKSLERQWLLVVVAGGDCDAQCEKLLYAQRQLREMMGKESDRMDRVWLINDEAPVRPAIAAAMQSGDPALVLRVPKDALVQWLQPVPGEPLEASLYVVDPMGHWMMRTPVPLEPMKFKRDLERLLKASAGWDREGRG